MKLNWEQKTKHFWEAQFEEFFLEVTQIIPEQSSKFQWVYTVTNSKYNIEYGSEHRGIRFLSESNAKDSCEVRLYHIIEFHRDVFQRMLDELETG